MGAAELSMGGPKLTTFKLGGPELHTVHASRAQVGEWRVSSGIDGLTILKTTKSAFTGYIKDKLTTLKPATDRIFGTSATADGTTNRRPRRLPRCGRELSTAMLKEFAVHDSKSVQHTLFDMGKAALVRGAGDLCV